MNIWRDTDYSRYSTTKEYGSTEEAARQRAYLQQAEGLLALWRDRLGRTPTCCVVTFGCQMNARDSEKLIGVLTQAGFVETEDESADLVVYNTCTVRDNANQRVYGRLGHLNAMKKRNPGKRIAICGCMVQEPEVIERLRTGYRFINLIFGTHNIYKFPELLVKMLESDEMVIDVWQKSDAVVEDLPVVRKYPFKSGVNIMYGCDNYCTYCIVPYVRGRERSRPVGEILSEVRRLAADGVSEVMLLGQNVNSYGKRYGTEDGQAEGMDFPGLLREVEGVDGIRRIRFMTSHPKDLSDRLIEVMAQSSKICSHLHLPVQSGSTEVLRRMNRHYTREDYLALVERLKAAMPDLSLTTDIIVGFPGETREDVDATVSLIREVGYDNAFTFIYSPRSGTPAADFTRTMTDEEIQDGFQRVLAAVQEEARKSVGRLKGQRGEALVEEMNSHDASMVTGRLSNNVLVHFKGDATMIGGYYQVELTENKGFYYIGKALLQAR